MKYKPYIQNQLYLIPPDIESLIPPDDICRSISQIVDVIDTGKFDASYGEEGNIAYHPRMMLKVIFYAYFNGIYSSRKIAKELTRNIYFWYLSGKQSPDFRTICRFIERHKKDMESVFAEIVHLCNKLGMIKLEHVAIDGSKIRAHVSKDKFRDYSKSLIEKGVVADHEEDQVYGQAESGELVVGTPPTRAEIKALYDEVKQGDAQRIDTECAVMKMSSGGVAPAYNAQIAVDEAHQVIVSAGVIREGTDQNALEARVEQTKELLNAYPKNVLADTGYWTMENIRYLHGHQIDGLICDKDSSTIAKEMKGLWDGISRGIFSKDRFEYNAAEDSYCCPAGNQLTYQNTNRAGYLKNGKQILKRIYYNKTACKVCSMKAQCTKTKSRIMYRFIDEELMEAMKAKMRTTAGYAHYKKRMKIVEPVFGNIKWNKRFTRFSFRGLARANAQFLMMTCIHNIEKIHNKLRNSPSFQVLRLKTEIDPFFRSIFQLFCALRNTFAYCSKLFPS